MYENRSDDIKAIVVIFDFLVFVLYTGQEIMLAIKLKRIGKKGQATYRIVVAEKRSKMTGTFTDDLGWWNPHQNKCVMATEKALDWIKKGAQPTATVHNLLVKKGALKTEKIELHKKPAKKEKK